MSNSEEKPLHVGKKEEGVNVTVKAVAKRVRVVKVEDGTQYTEGTNPSFLGLLYVFLKNVETVEALQCVFASVLPALPEQDVWMVSVFKLSQHGKGFVEGLHCVSNAYVRTCYASKVVFGYLKFLKGCLKDPRLCKCLSDLYSPTVEGCMRNIFLCIGLIQQEVKKKTVAFTVLVCDPQCLSGGTIYLVAIYLAKLKDLNPAKFGECSLRENSSQFTLVHLNDSLLSGVVLSAPGSIPVMKWMFTSPRVAKPREAKGTKKPRKAKGGDSGSSDDYISGEAEDEEESDDDDVEKKVSVRRVAKESDGAAPKRRRSAGESAVSDTGKRKKKTVPPGPTGGVACANEAGAVDSGGVSVVATGQKVPSVAGPPVFFTRDEFKEGRRKLKESIPVSKDAAPAGLPGSAVSVVEGQVIIQPPTVSPESAGGGAPSSEPPVVAPVDVKDAVFEARLDTAREEAISYLETAEQPSSKAFKDDLLKRLIHLQRNHPDEMDDLMRDMGWGVHAPPLLPMEPKEVDEWGGCVSKKRVWGMQLLELNRKITSSHGGENQLTLHPFFAGEKPPEIILSLAVKCKAVDDKMLNEIICGLQDSLLVYLFLRKLLRLQHLWPATGIDDRVVAVLKRLRFVVALGEKYGGNVFSSGLYFDSVSNEFRNLEESSAVLGGLSEKYKEMFELHSGSLNDLMTTMRVPESLARRYAYCEVFKKHPLFKNWCRDVCKTPAMKKWMERPPTTKSIVDVVFEEVYPCMERDSLPALQCDEEGISTAENDHDADLITGSPIALPILAARQTKAVVVANPSP